MCDFHLNGQCFHPEKARKGLVAVTCNFHNCKECTNKQWQQDRIEQNFQYYQSIVDIINISESVEKQTIWSRIFSAKEKVAKQSGSD